MKYKLHSVIIVDDNGGHWHEVVKIQKSYETMVQMEKEIDSQLRKAKKRHKNKKIKILSRYSTKDTKTNTQIAIARDNAYNGNYADAIKLMNEVIKITEDDSFKTEIIEWSKLSHD